MLKNLFGTSIRSVVMKTIEQRIESAQKIYDVEARALKKSKSEKMWAAFNEACDRIKQYGIDYRAKKEELKQRHVDNILAKIL